MRPNVLLDAIDFVRGMDQMSSDPNDLCMEHKLLVDVLRAYHRTFDESDGGGTFVEDTAAAVGEYLRARAGNLRLMELGVQ